MITHRSLRSLLHVLACAVVLPHCGGSSAPPVEVAPPPATAAPAASATPASASSTAPQPATSAIGDKNILVVSFVSPGNGTDHVAYDGLRSMLTTLPKVPPFVSHRWGKEGEHDECFDLSTFSLAERRAFVAKINEVARSSKKVTVTENGTCHEGR